MTTEGRQRGKASAGYLRFPPAPTATVLPPLDPNVLPFTADGDAERRLLWQRAAVLNVAAWKLRTEAEDLLERVLACVEGRRAA